MAHDPTRLALEAFMDEESSDLRRLAYLLCGDWTKADTVLQDALVELVRSGVDLEDTPRCLATTRRSIVRACQGLVPPPSEDPLADGLRQLDPTERAVLVLGWFTELPDEQLRRALDTTADVDQLKASAVEHLRTLLAAQGHELDDSLTAPVVRPSRARHAEADEL